MLEKEALLRRVDALEAAYKDADDFDSKSCRTVEQVPAHIIAALNCMIGSGLLLAICLISLKITIYGYQIEFLQSISEKERRISVDINTGRTIKSRLAALGKTQKDLFMELNSRGAKLSTIQQLYQYTNGYNVTYKSQVILAASLKIISEWEEKQR